MVMDFMGTPLRFKISNMNDNIGTHTCIHHKCLSGKVINPQLAIKILMIFLDSLQKFCCRFTLYSVEGCDS